MSAFCCFVFVCLCVFFVFVLFCCFSFLLLQLLFAFPLAAIFDGGTPWELLYWFHDNNC